MTTKHFNRIEHKITLWLSTAIVFFMFGLLGSRYILSDQLKTHTQAKQAIYKCEQTLPRNQHCEVSITAVPIKD